MSEQGTHCADVDGVAAERRQPGQGWRLTLTVENDVFTGSDNNGVGIAWVLEAIARE